MLWKMNQGDGLRALGNVLDAAEAASPVESVEAVTRELALAMGATAVSFLIADLSGRAGCGSHTFGPKARGYPVANHLRTENGEMPRSPRQSCLSTAGRKSKQCAPRT